MDFQRENERLKKEIQELRDALKAAEQKIEELMALLNQNSRNSNWPSSRDKSRKKKRTKSLRPKSDKKPGGQKGHQGHTLEFSEKPDAIEVHRPTHCEHCQTPFSENEHAVALDKRQVHDLPPMRLIVYEHQAETLYCRQCGQMSQGDFPCDVTSPVQYGPLVQQLAVYLKAEQFIPYDRSRQFFADLFELNISPGTLQNIIRRTARQLQPVVENIKEGLIASEVVHFDESGFYIGGKRHWLHTAGTKALTCYYPHARRGRKATDAMDILPRFQGTAIHDFWSAYRQYQQCGHGLCNTHHLRELTAVVENDAQRWARHFQFLLISAKQAVEQARLAGQSALPKKKVNQIERIYTQLIQMGLRTNPPPSGGWPRGKRGRVKKTKARNLIERLDKHRPEVLAFVYDFKVPFDNNLAERDIRMLKVQQKISGCFRSQTGAEDFCTIRSYISTMRKQNVSVWSALGSVFSSDILLPETIPV
jgi:transposase